jgi:hypothetical protein
LHTIEQAPAAQPANPCTELHAWPHVPQWVVLVSVWVSHPFAASPSQLPQPLSHVPTRHAPVVQAPTACAGAHASAHPPQSVNVRMFVSQPFDGFPSQLAYAAAHVGTHAPFMHVCVPFAFVHPAPHEPQFVVVFSGASQPFEGLASQLPQPPLHEISHPPLTHCVVPFDALQAARQAPQCDVLFVRFVSHPFCTAPSQLPQPALHAIAHSPTLHEAVPPALEHSVEHVPQWFGSVARLISQPFTAFPSQSPSPALQAMEQAPLLQVGVPVLPSHTLPHTPQLLASLTNWLSQPFSRFASQSPNPGLHRIWQVPAMHTGCPFVALHALPQAPH